MPIDSRPRGIPSGPDHGNGPPPCPLLVDAPEFFDRDGGPYQGPFSQPYNFAELIVMNVFDPCSAWDYGDDEIFSDDFETGNTSAWDDVTP